VKAALIIVEPPGFDNVLGLGKRTELGEATGPQATDLKCPVKPDGQFSTACGP
jgi:hypothetical protein